jgi:hypothetical protein
MEVQQTTSYSNTEVEGLRLTNEVDLPPPFSILLCYISHIKT